MNKETLKKLDEQALDLADSRAMWKIKIVCYAFVYSLVAIAGYSGYRAEQGTNLPWSVWIPPFIIGLIAIYIAGRPLYKIKQEIARRTKHKPT